MHFTFRQVSGFSILRLKVISNISGYAFAVFILYSLLFIAATIGVVSIIMSYDELNRLGLIVAAVPIVLTLIVFAKWSIDGGTLTNIVTYFDSPDVSRNLPVWLFVIGLITCLTLFREGTVFWVWRRLHPKSAPTETLGTSERGSGIRQTVNPMSAALMGSSTAMFQSATLDIRTIALIRLAFAAFSKTDRKTIIGIESFLKLGDGRKYRAYQQLVAEVLDSKTTMKDIIHPYWRAINGNSATARILFADLCRLANETGNKDKRSINNIIKAGRELGLSQEDMQRAF